MTAPADDDPSPPTAEEAPAAARARQLALITASRRVQGARSRRATAAEQLFKLCAFVRARVKSQFRGPKHVALRVLYGEAFYAHVDKPHTVLSFANHLDKAQEERPDVPRLAGIRPQTLLSITRWRLALEQAQADAQSLEQARRTVRETHGLPRIGKKRLR